MRPPHLPMLIVANAFRRRPLPRRRSRVVVDVVDAAPIIAAHFPARRQGLGPFPRRRSSVMINVVFPVELIEPHLPAGRKLFGRLVAAARRRSTADGSGSTATAAAPRRSPTSISLLSATATATASRPRPRRISRWREWACTCPSSRGNFLGHWINDSDRR